MKVREIHFNHDPLSMSSDAITIRQTYAGDRIAAPEWREAYPALPVAYASGALGGTVTIKARFANGPPNSVARIRAIDADLPQTGCLGLLLYFILSFIKTFAGNVLGSVGEKDVSFDASGNSSLETLVLANHKLKTSAVGIRTTRWTWQVRGEDGWTDFETTQHRIYVILGASRSPWNQQLTPVATQLLLGPLDGVIFFNNTQLPWADALEVACSWAAGSRTAHDAASAITRAVNSRTLQVYDTQTYFGGFWLSNYLTMLNGGGSFLTNCTDCANAVTTLANLLGCDLWEQYFFTPFDLTKPFLTLNGDPLLESDWVSYTWSYHEFGWLGPANPSGSVYDGCLQVDMDDNPNDEIHIAKHPTGMPFPGYKDRLWDATGGLDPAQARRAVF